MVNILNMEDLLEQPGWNTRKMILEEVKKQSKNINELVNKLGLNYSTIRYHLELLEKFGLVKEERIGRKRYFQITKEGLVVLNEKW